MIPNLLLLVISVPAKVNIRLLLSYNAVKFRIPTLNYIFGSIPILIYIPQLDGNILVLHQLLDIVSMN